jgi:hypothetical protein
MTDAAPSPPAPGEHWSDCAVHNGPALPVGPCDCGASSPPAPGEVEWLRAVLTSLRLTLQEMTAISQEWEREYYGEATPAPSKEGDGE